MVRCWSIELLLVLLGSFRRGIYFMVIRIGLAHADRRLVVIVFLVTVLFSSCDCVVVFTVLFSLPAETPTKEKSLALPITYLASHHHHDDHHGTARHGFKISLTTPPSWQVKLKMSASLWEESRLKLFAHKNLFSPLKYAPVAEL